MQKYSALFIGSYQEYKSFVRENEFRNDEVRLLNKLIDIVGFRDCIIFYKSRDRFYESSQDDNRFFEGYSYSHNIKLIKVL